MHISRNATNINIVSPYLFIPLLTRNTRAEKGRIAARENDMRKRTLEYIVRRRRPPGGLGTRFNAMHRALHARSNAISCLTTPYPRSPRHDTVTAYKSYARSRGTRVCVIPTPSSDRDREIVVRRNLEENDSPTAFYEFLTFQQIESFLKFGEELRLILFNSIECCEKRFLRNCCKSCIKV